MPDRVSGASATLGPSIKLRGPDPICPCLLVTLYRQPHGINQIGNH